MIEIWDYFMRRKKLLLLALMVFVASGFLVSQLFRQYSSKPEITYISISDWGTPDVEVPRTGGDFLSEPDNEVPAQDIPSEPSDSERAQDLSTEPSDGAPTQDFPEQPYQIVVASPADVAALAPAAPIATDIEPIIPDVPYVGGEALDEDSGQMSDEMFEQIVDSLENTENDSIATDVPTPSVSVLSIVGDIILSLLGALAVALCAYLVYQHFMR